MRIFAVVQEDPCPVFVPDAHVDVGRLKIKFPGSDNKLVLAYDGHRRHIHLQGARTSNPRQLNCITYVIQILPGYRAVGKQ